MNSLMRIVLIVTLALLSFGCSDDNSRKRSSAAPADQVAPKAKSVVTPQVSEAQTDDDFEYVAEGLRDPFKPFFKPARRRAVKKKTATVAPKVVPKTPLQKFAIEEIKLVGVVWGGEGRSKALVEDPAGKGYVVYRGTFVGDRGGAIASISTDKLIVEERFVDVLGQETVRTFEMKLHRSEEAR